jgi:hypothetical protein
MILLILTSHYQGKNGCKLVNFIMKHVRIHK